MKRIVLLAFACTFLISLGACGNDKTDDEMFTDAKTTVCETSQATEVTEQHSDNSTGNDDIVSTMQSSISGWHQAYTDNLTELISGEDSSYKRFTLAYIDNDEIPELCVSEGDFHSSGVEVFTYKNNKVVSLGVFGALGVFEYSERAGKIYSSFTNNDIISCVLYTCKNGVASVAWSCEYAEIFDENKQQLVIACKVNGVDVSENEYNSQYAEVWDADPHKTNDINGDRGYAITDDNIAKYVMN